MIRVWFDKNNHRDFTFVDVEVINGVLRLFDCEDKTLFLLREWWCVERIQSLQGSANE